MTDKIFTLDDFYNRIIQPMADRGDPAGLAVLEARKLAQEGKLTADDIKRLVKKAVP